MSAIAQRMTRPIQFRLLRGVQLRGPDGRDVEAVLAQPRRLALLAYLVSAHPGLRTRDSVIGVFWPEADQAHARAALRQALWFLRRELGEQTIVNQGEAVGIRPGAIECDIVAFQELCSAARWNDALDLYRGDLLDGFFVTDAAPEIERWLDDERARLRRLAQHAVRELVKSKDRDGDTAGALSAARRWLSISPHDEHAVRALVALLDRSGDRAGAIRHFEEFAHVLRKEYDVLPSPETLALVDSVRGRSEVRPGTSVALERDVANTVLQHAETSADRTAEGTAEVPRRTPRRSAFAIMSAAILALGGITAWVAMQRAASVRSVAVLPPSSLTMSAPPAALGDITESVIARLSKFERLTVLAYSTVQRYATTTTSPQRLGRELNVGAVLSWSAKKEGDTVRIGVELVHTRTGALLWSQSYARGAGDLLGIDNEIALDAARELRGPVTADERFRLSRIGTRDIEAQRLYLRGRQAWVQRSESAIRNAISYFEQALERDPGYAEAHAGIADCYIVLGRQQWLPPDVAFPAARAAAQRALALDSALAEAHASLAVVLNRYDWDRSGSLREFERAIQLSPSYATAWHWYSITLETVGRTEEALAAGRRALELDPLSPMVRTSYGDRNFYARRYDEAVRQIRYVLQVNPDFVQGHLHLGLILLAMHEPEKARNEFERAIELTDSTVGLDKLAYSYVLLGRAAEARAIVDRLDEFSRDKWVSPVARAEIHLALGDTAMAFSLLDQAVRQKDDELVMLHINPRLNRLRDTPRFRALLKRLNLPLSSYLPTR